MNLMGCRLTNLQYIYDGYLKTGIPLIAFDGNNYFQPITGDDIGIYVLIPKLAKFFNLPLSSAIDIFFYSLLFAPLLLGSVAFILMHKNWIERLVAIGCLILLTRFAYAVGDVYLASNAASVILIPWGLLLSHKNNVRLPFFSFLIGLLAGFLHHIRAFSAVAPWIFVLLLVLTRKNYSRKNKYLFMLGSWLGFAVPGFYFKNEVAISNGYACQQLGLSHAVGDKHVFWHQAYIGLGLLNMKNNDDIRYDDSVAWEKVKILNKNATYCSSEYENTLKREFSRLVFDQTLFFILTIFAKIGILLYFLIKFANVGIIAAFFYPKSLIIDLSFIAALFFNALFCLIAIPMHEYALGFISCATLWAIVSINHAIRTFKPARWLPFKNHIIQPQ